MAPGAIDRDADDCRLEFVKLGENFIIERHLITAHRTPVGRVERQYQRSAAEVAQRNELVRCTVQRKIRGRSAGREYFVCVFSHDGKSLLSFLTDPKLFRGLSVLLFAEAKGAVKAGWSLQRRAPPGRAAAIVIPVRACDKPAP